MKKKKCPKCGKMKPVDEFYKDRSNKDGLTNRCKGCEKAASKEYRDANPEKVKAARKKYRKKKSGKTKSGR